MSTGSGPYLSLRYGPDLRLLALPAALARRRDDPDDNSAAAVRVLARRPRWQLPRRDVLNRHLVRIQL